MVIICKTLAKKKSHFLIDFEVSNTLSNISSEVQVCFPFDGIRWNQSFSAFRSRLTSNRQPFLELPASNDFMKLKNHSTQPRSGIDLFWILRNLSLTTYFHLFCQHQPHVSFLSSLHLPKICHGATLARRYNLARKFRWKILVYLRANMSSFDLIFQLR